MSDFALALFFSHGTTLASWEQQGLWDREVGYYRELSRHIGPILFVTYDRDTPDWADRLDRLQPIGGVANRWRVPYQVFGLLAPLLHRQTLRRCAAFKTNQLRGAWTGAIAKLLLRKPLIVRCGFVWSQFVREASLYKRLVMLIERLSVRAADLVLVATEADRQFLMRTHNLPAERVQVLPNPIDTLRFCPIATLPERGRIAFVGRLESQKNLPLLFEALEQLGDCKLSIAGNGTLEVQLKALARPELVEFCGIVSNHDLPQWLNRAEVFVMPSQYEGSPKALLEAMSCGLAVVGTNVPGIRDVIQHGVNGWLCASTADDLADAIRSLLANAELRQRMGQAARQYVIEHYAQVSVADKEAALLSQLLHGDDRLPCQGDNLGE